MKRTFYTYFKSTNIDKLPRIDMLNMFSAYIGYQSWYEFKKSFSEETADLEDEVEAEYLPEPKLEKKTENSTSLLDTKPLKTNPIKNHHFLV